MTRTRLPRLHRTQSVPEIETLPIGQPKPPQRWRLGLHVKGPARLKWGRSRDRAKKDRSDLAKVPLRQVTESVAWPVDGLLVPPAKRRIAL